MGMDVIVVNFQTPADLGGFLESFEAHAQPDDRLHIALVEPGPADWAMANAWKEHPQLVSMISFPTNVGYGAACNMAARLAETDIIGFFNADTRLRAAVTRQCADALRGNPAWGILGPRQVDDENRLTAAGIIGTRAAPRHRGWREFDNGQYSDVVVCPTVSGSALFIRRDLWRELTDCPDWQKVCPGTEGAMMESHYYSETLLCYHAAEHGALCTYYGPVAMVHRWHKASPVNGRVEQNMPAEQARFRALCDAMHGGIEHD